MGANQFLPFGTDGAANVIDQASYAALPSRNAGFTAGTAQSAQLNKVWRQSSLMAAMIGQLIADYSGADAVDDGNVAALETKMIAALRGALQSSTAGVVGQVRNARMAVSAAAFNAVFTADEVIVESTLGGVRYCISGFNQAINLSTIGAGGMDTGSSPSNGFVGIYAIYNPVSNARSLMAVNATSARLPEVYSGANMPAGYIASALISVWPTDGNGKLKVCKQRDRHIGIVSSNALTTTVIQPTAKVLSLAGIVPKNAMGIGGTMQISVEGNAAAGPGIGVYVQLGQDLAMTEVRGAYMLGIPLVGTNYDLRLETEQTIYYTFVAIGTPLTPTLSMTISSYDF